MLCCPECGENSFIATEQVYAHSHISIDGEGNTNFLGVPDIDFGNDNITELTCIECGWYVSDPVMPLGDNLVVPVPEAPAEDLPDADF